MTYPQWLQPPAPKVTGTVREHSQAEEFRIAAEEWQEKERERKQDPAEVLEERRIRAIKKREATKRAKLEEDLQRRGETMEDRHRRQSRESYWRHRDKRKAHALAMHHAKKRGNP